MIRFTKTSGAVAAARPILRSGSGSIASSAGASASSPASPAAAQPKSRAALSALPKDGEMILLCSLDPGETPSAIAEAWFSTSRLETTEPSASDVQTKTAETPPKFDRAAYQREYMRKRRSEKRGKINE